MNVEIPFLHPLIRSSFPSFSKVQATRLGPGSMSWWWAGALGVVMKSRRRRPPPPEYNSVALVVGATGVVGTSLVDILPQEDTPGGPWKVYAVSRRLPLLQPANVNGDQVIHIYCDLTAMDAAEAELRPIAAQITHIFYVTWTQDATEEARCVSNPAMLRNVLSAVVPAAPRLQHVCLQTGWFHYTGPSDQDAANLIHDPPYRESMPRLPGNNFYYSLEDTLVSQLAGTPVRYSVHRPSVVFGFSPRSTMSLVGPLCAYAAICKREGSTLKWPGTKEAYECFSDAVDADLAAEQQIWAAVENPGEGQAYNCTNGDVFRWKHLWSLLARKFGISEVEGYTGEDGRFSLQERMAEKGEVWTSIATDHQLLLTNLDEFGTWWLPDLVLNRQTPQLCSMNKCKDSGFLGYRDSVASFLACIDMMKACNFVPL